VVNETLARGDTISLGALKRGVNTPLSRLGHGLVREGEIPSFGRLDSCLRRASLASRTVIDLGVACGTPWLYSAFPDAKFRLVDPTRKSLPHMRAWAREVDADVHNVALGAGSAWMRSTTIHSSPFRGVTNSAFEDKYDVPVRRFDALLPRLDRPALCNVDADGAELMVLKGMGGQIHDLDVITFGTG
jgi:FkbM family methyltransferase